MMLPVAILAGGLATRCGPSRRQIPKSWSRSTAGRSPSTRSTGSATKGSTHIVFCVGHLGEQVVEALGDGARWGMRFDYRLRRPDAARHRRRISARACRSRAEAFFVLYGDSLSRLRPGGRRRAFEASGRTSLDDRLPATTNRWDRSNVVFEDGEIVRYDKTDATPDMQPHRLRPRRALVARRSMPYPADDAVRPGPGVSGSAAGRPAWRATRWHAVLRDRIAGRARGDPSRISPAAEPRSEVMSYARQHLEETAAVVAGARRRRDRARRGRARGRARRGGRLFFLGVGGSAANCSHAVNDFRKLAGFEAYAPTDNVPELTARTNDEGWDTVFVAWLRAAGCGRKTASSSFGRRRQPREEHQPQPRARAAVRREVGATIVGIVGRDGGYTAQVADACVIVPTVNPDTVTPHAEAFQAVVWHLLVSHPRSRRQRPNGNRRGDGCSRRRRNRRRRPRLASREVAEDPAAALA